MNKSIIIVLKVETSDSELKVDIVNLYEEIDNIEVPKYTGPLNVSTNISTTNSNWISCSTNDNLEDWIIYYKS